MKAFKSDAMRFTLPVIAENIFTTGVGLIYSAIVGGISASSLAAMGTGNQAINLVVALFAVITTGGVVLTAQLTGRSDIPRASRVVEPHASARARVRAGDNGRAAGGFRAADAASDAGRAGGFCEGKHRLFPHAASVSARADHDERAHRPSARVRRIANRASEQHSDQRGADCGGVSVHQQDGHEDHGCGLRVCGVPLRRRDCHGDRRVRASPRLSGGAAAHLPAVHARGARDSARGVCPPAWTASRCRRAICSTIRF